METNTQGRPHTAWTPQELEYLHANLDKPAAQIAAHLNRTVYAVKFRLYKLNNQTEREKTDCFKMHFGFSLSAK